MSSASSTIRVFLSHQGDGPRMFITTRAEEEWLLSEDSTVSGCLDMNGNDPEVVVFTWPQHGHVDSLHHFLPAKLYSHQPIFDELTLLRKKLWGELRHTRYALSALSSQRSKVREHYQDEHWLRLMADLLRQAQSWKIKFDFHRLVAILKVAERDPRIAYDQLTAMFQRELAQRKARIQRRLRAVAAAQAVFCSLSLASYSVRNLISSQRSWFLHHGAHPSRLTTLAAQGCFSRVCFQPT
jgi:hypothetical protein